jgi:DNA-binding NarL/FixJ family response regulator
MSYHRHVLVVDNDECLVQAAKHALELREYYVPTARTATEAKSILDQERIHVAIIDIRLEDDSDEYDRSGLALAREVDSAVGKVIITGFPLTSDAAYQIYGSDATGIDPVPRFVPKEEGPHALLRGVDWVFQEQLGINEDLEIEYRPGAEPDALVEQIKDLASADESVQRTIARELDDLLRKLFRNEQAITVYGMTPGRGGSGVARVRPRYRNMEGGFVVVKFGQRDNFKLEETAYRQYIDPFLPKYATFMRGDPARTQRLGGAKFLFVGMSGDEPGDFQHFYLNPHIPEDAITQAIRSIFTKSWKTWYDQKRDWNKGKGPDLLESFTAHLFREQKHWDELRGSVNALLDDKPFRGVSFKRTDEASDQIEMRMGNKKWLLPDPVDFLTSQTHLIPKPKFTCVIHGDLNPRNVFIDELLNAWLIDFFKTGEGPALRDVVDLESSIKFQLLQTNNLAALIEFESATLAPTTLGEEIRFKNTFNLQQLDRALTAIQELRSIAYDIAEDDDIQEYYASLLFFAAKMITWRGISSLETKRQPIRQRHALYSAALICERFLSETEGFEKELV